MRMYLSILVDCPQRTGFVQFEPFSNCLVEVRVADAVMPVASTIAKSCALSHCEDRIYGVLRLCSG